MTHYGKSENANSSNESFNYSRLRDWYLARLRKRILQLKSYHKLTPAELIYADMVFFDKLGEQAQGASQPVKKQPGLNLLTGSMFLIPVLAQLPLMALLLNNVHLSAALTAAIVVATAGFFWALLTSVISLCTAEAASMVNQQLSDIPSLESTSYPQKAGAGGIRVFDDLVRFLLTVVHQVSQRESAIADYAMDFFCAIDENGNFVGVSPGVSQFSGHAEDFLIGKSIVDILPAEDAERVKNVFQGIAKASGPVPFQSRLRHAAGWLMDVSWVAEWSNREHICFLIGRDITDQMRLQRMREEFVAIVGHDLRTPITAIACSLDVLAPGIQERHRELLTRTRQSIAQLLELINSLLDLEKIDQGKMPMELEDVPLSTIFAKSVDAVSPLSGTSGIAIDVQPTDLNVRADPSRIQQVMVNLLSNALKYSPPKSRVVVGASTSGNQALIQIDDEGPGIPSGFEQKVFDRYYQISRSDRSQGSGLGLAICRSIVLLHQGAIGVENRATNGSRFWFSLPLSRGKQVPASRSPEA